MQKFNEEKGWELEDLEALKENLDISKEGRREANRLINSLKICDPAVGSGHFLVSALNEILALKSELGILSYRDGSRMKFYRARVENDELIIEDNDEGGIFEYGLSQKGSIIPEKQAVQEAIFHEKQTIIENCLFGVDINPNSVKICRLRLWIELLKHAYYHPSRTPQSPKGEARNADAETKKEAGDNPESETPRSASRSSEGEAARTVEAGTEGNELELQTLPNIDINIKAGNSLISRFALNSSLEQALKRSSWKVEDYRMAVNSYKNAESKDEKRGLLAMIDQVKKDFRTEISRDSPKQRQLNKLEEELYEKYTGNKLFEEQLTQKQKQDRAKLEQKINKLHAEIEDLKNNEIYRNAFEWRFEFPEVLDDEGNFMGFDVVIGNPPYINIYELAKNKGIQEYYKKRFLTNKKKIDIYILFTELGLYVMKNNGHLCYICSDRWLMVPYGEALREFILKQKSLIEVVKFPEKMVFDEATVDVAIFSLKNHINSENKTKIKHFKENQYKEFTQIPQVYLNDPKTEFRIFTDTEFHQIKLFKEKFEVKDCIDLGEILYINWGLRTGDMKNLTSKEKIDKQYKPLIHGKNVSKYKITEPQEYVCYKIEKLYNPMFPELFENEKLVIRDITKNESGILAAKDINNYYCEHTLSVAIEKYKVDGVVRGKKQIKYLPEEIEISKQYDLNYLLGLMNSSLIGQYFRNLLSDGLHSYPNNLKKIPVKKCSKKQQRLIAEKVKKINDNNSEKDNLKKEIDQMVYDLYGLTEEERRIVEEGVE